MSKLRQGDILLFNTEDGGEIKVVNGEPVMDGGFESAIYLSLFQGDGKSHWMEEYQNESEKSRSEGINFIEGNNKTISNINRAIILFQKDLQWLIDKEIADIIDIDFDDVSIIRSKFTINILKNGNTVSKIEFQVNWNYQKSDPASGRL